MMITTYENLKRSDFVSFDTQNDIYKIVVDHNLVTVFYTSAFNTLAREYELIDDDHLQDGTIVLNCKDHFYGGSKIFHIKSDGDVEVR